MKLLPALLLPAVALLALGCAGSSASDVDEDDSAISAKEANERSQGLKNHVLVASPADKKTRDKLGIETWDVFAGTDLKSGFTGAVFYASDAAGDAKYAFAVDAVKKEMLFAVLSKDGTTEGDAKRVDESSYALLLSDVGALRDRLAGMRSDTPSSEPAPSDRYRCAIDLAAVGLTIVVVAGSPFLAMASVWFGFAGAGALAAGETMTGVLFLGGVAGTWTAIAGYSGKVLSAVVDAPRACL